VHVEGGKLNSRHKKEDLKIWDPSNSGGCTKDVSIGVSFAGEVDSCLLNNDTHNGQHANAPVLQFRPTSILQVRLDVRAAIRTLFAFFR